MRLQEPSVLAGIIENQVCSLRQALNADGCLKPKGKREGMKNGGKVALLVDFENLVFGLQEMHGDEYAEFVDPELLFRLAEEYGQVVMANAYADWRSRDVNQFQTDLYRLGIELVHVLAKRQQNRFKNAVDVKMAVDAVETVWALPDVETFVIVSGDRDFIHVLKSLRRHGKAVIGISPDQAVSEDFASLCDRFVRYGALLASYATEASIPQRGANEDPLQDVRSALKGIMAERPEGVAGAQIKPLLRRRLSATFDESELGFSRLSDLLRALPGIVEIVRGPGGDITVVPAGRQRAEKEAADKRVMAPVDHPEEDPIRELMIAAQLVGYGFEPNAKKRRRVLGAVFAGMEAEEPFTMAGVFDHVLHDNDSLALSVSRLAKYQTILWQSRCFSIEPNQQDKSVRDRLMRLQSDIGSAEDLVFRYEASIAYKLAAAARAQDQVLDPSILRQVLGLAEMPEELAYCAELITHST